MPDETRDLIFDTINYLKSRSSKSIIWEINSKKKKILAPINSILFKIVVYQYQKCVSI